MQVVGMTQSSNTAETNFNGKETLAESFRRYFSVSLAMTPEQKDATYQIRYRVYCEEFGFENAAEFPDHREQDQFDSNSLHCLITHKATMRPAGCVRLVTTGGHNLDKLPLEAFCASSLDAGVMERFENHRDSIGEVSRLAVDGAFRQRSTESETRFGGMDAIDCSRRERRTFSLISVAGFLAATSLTELTGRTNVFAMMEPFLPKLLARSGIMVEKIGRDIDYHGIRAPYLTTTDAAIAGMPPELGELYQAIHDDLSVGYDQYLREKNVAE
jgi:N-acyl amino acid synthase of PEP-CTERM/exosortase system